MRFSFALQSVSRKSTAATKEQHRPPEKQSVLKHLREIQERNKQNRRKDSIKNPLTEIADRKNTAQRLLAGGVVHITIFISDYLTMVVTYL